MPSKNSIKLYLENGIYHIYNRGVEKRNIFLDTRDYKTFFYFLKQYLLPEDDPLRDIKNFNGRTFTRRSFSEKINLLAYCLMPNHFHLLIKQSGEKDIAEFMKCLITSYSIYFNDRYKRVGSLFQGRYKAALVQEDNYLLHLSLYIHLNPYKGQTFVNFANNDFSSYANYLGKRNSKWVKPDLILDYFKDYKEEDIFAKNSYKEFVEDNEIISEEILGNLMLED